MSRTACRERVMGDAARLRQVLLNLAGNAVKFTERGGVAIIVEPGDWPGRDRLLVRDTGIGIAPEEQSRIFLEFEQADGGSAPQVRRHRPRPRHLQAHRRAHGRHASRSTARPAPARPSTSRCHCRDRAPPSRRHIAPPDLAGTDVLIVAPGATSASLVARRLMTWGARTCLVPDEQVAFALIPERVWSAVLVDHALGAAACERLARTTNAIPAAHRADHARPSGTRWPRSRRRASPATWSSRCGRHRWPRA